MSNNNDTIKSNWIQEKSELMKTKELGIKAKSFTKEQSAQIITEGGDIIRQHIDTYREEFVKFFATNPTPLLGFDVEENLKNLPICLMGLQILPNLAISIKPITLNGPPSPEQTNKLEKEIICWIQTEGPGSKILIHGSNPQEGQILNQISNAKINTQKVLEYAIDKHIQPTPKSPGLPAFENALHFQRTCCGFIKDVHLNISGRERKDFAYLFPSQSMASLTFRSNNKAQRICRLCGKPQDVLLYCLEDVFLTLLILVFYANRGYK
jgi:hypothetical protein